MRVAVIIAAVVVLCDAATKLLGRAVLSAPGFTLFPGIVLRVVDNPRGPFSLGSVGLAAGLSLVVLLFLISCLHSARSSPRAAAFLALMLGGGVANVGERLLFGQSTNLVVLAEWTAVNVADLAIGLGTIGLILEPLVRRRAVAGYGAS
jgi:lipoprotein signal peptidase